MDTPFAGILHLTFRELWDKKIVIGLLILSTLVWVFLLFALDPEAVSLPPAVEEEFGPEGPPREFLMRQVVDRLAPLISGLSYWGGTLLALFAAAPLFSGFIRRGHVELLLSKPLSRTTLFAGHVTGVFLMMTLLACYLIGAVWLVLGLRTGIWNASFLLTIPILVGMFGALYAAVVLLEIWTESTALGLFAAFGLVLLSIFFLWHERLSETLGAVTGALFEAAYRVFPNFAEVAGLVLVLARGDAVEDWYPLVSSLLFAAACYALAAWWFSRRDF